MGREGRGWRVLDAGRSGVGREDRAAGTPGEDGKSGWWPVGWSAVRGSWPGWQCGAGQAWGRGFGVLGREAPGLTDVLWGCLWQPGEEAVCGIGEPALHCGPALTQAARTAGTSGGRADLGWPVSHAWGTSVSWVFSPFLRVPGQGLLGQGLLRTEQQQPKHPGTSSLEWLLNHFYVCRKFTTTPSLKTDTITSPPPNRPRWKLTLQDEHKNIRKISFKAAAQVLENTSMSD